MAAGTVVSSISSVAAGATLEYQPSAGVTAMIFCVGSDKTSGSTPDVTPNILVRLYDGTKFSDVYRTTGATIFMVQRILLSNSLYLQIYNNDAASANISYAGITLKWGEHNGWSIIKWKRNNRWKR